MRTDNSLCGTIRSPVRCLAAILTSIYPLEANSIFIVVTTEMLADISKVGKIIPCWKTQSLDKWIYKCKVLEAWTNLRCSRREARVARVETAGGIRIKDTTKPHPYVRQNKEFGFYSDLREIASFEQRLWFNLFSLHLRLWSFLPSSLSPCSLFSTNLACHRY